MHVDSSLLLSIHGFTLNDYMAWYSFSSPLGQETASGTTLNLVVQELVFYTFLPGELTFYDNVLVTLAYVALVRKAADNENQDFYLNSS
jgi:hypothetical protein